MNRNEHETECGAEHKRREAPAPLRVLVIAVGPRECASDRLRETVEGIVGRSLVIHGGAS